MILLQRAQRRRIRQRQNLLSPDFRTFPLLVDTLCLVSLVSLRVIRVAALHPYPNNFTFRIYPSEFKNPSPRTSSPGNLPGNPRANLPANSPANPRASPRTRPPACFPNNPETNSPTNLRSNLPTNPRSHPLSRPPGQPLSDTPSQSKNWHK